MIMTKPKTFSEFLVTSPLYESVNANSFTEYKTDRNILLSIPYGANIDESYDSDKFDEVIDDYFSDFMYAPDSVSFSAEYDDPDVVFGNGNFYANVINERNDVNIIKKGKDNFFIQREYEKSCWVTVSTKSGDANLTNAKRLKYYKEIINNVSRSFRTNISKGANILKKMDSRVNPTKVIESILNKPITLATKKISESGTECSASFSLERNGNDIRLVGTFRANTRPDAKILVGYKMNIAD